MDWTKYYEELNRYLHLRTWPVAVKYYKDASEKPKGTIKPREPLNACQITSLARYYGRNLYFTAEDMACIIGAVTLGLYPAPEHTISGEIASLLHKTKKGAKDFVDSVSIILYKVHTEKNGNKRTLLFQVVDKRWNGKNRRESGREVAPDPFP